MTKSNPLIYIAGPLFSEGNRWLLERVDEVCREVGFDTYLPHRDAGLFTRDELGSATFFNRDVEQLDKAYFVVAVLNGTDVDSGTSWEMGYVYARETPIIGYLADTRIYDPQQQLNPMIVNSLHDLAGNLRDLRTILERVRQQVQ